MNTASNARPEASGIAFEHPPVLVVMGVSGSGKTTFAELIAGRLGWDLQEGDALHPEANVAKMASGVPLTDDDRWPWLDRIAAWIDAHLAAGEPAVITCSALKRSYRDRLARPNVVFVHLAGGRELIADRLEHRTGHYMPASLLGSQFETLEPLEPGERGLVVDAQGTPEDEVAEAIARLGLEGGSGAH
ncbi:MAG TPA: gluconokinase, GntK/IdnK-type [Agromyces sp.]